MHTRTHVFAATLLRGNQPINELVDGDSDKGDEF